MTGNYNVSNPCDSHTYVRKKSRTISKFVYVVVLAAVRLAAVA